jgi:hypothetical protein
MKTTAENYDRLIEIVLPPAERLTPQQRKRWAKALAYRRYSRKEGA